MAKASAPEKKGKKRKEMEDQKNPGGVEGAAAMAVPTNTAKRRLGIDTGLARLLQLGYKQELKLDLSVIGNFAFSFSIISSVTGVTFLYGNGLMYGGPVVMVYGFLLVGGFTMLVGLSMVEICSAYPTSGGLYYWSAKLAGPDWAPFASWMTGWFNVVGQWTGTASGNFALAQLLQVIILLSTGEGKMATEETKNSDKNGPVGMLYGIGISIIVGWAYIIGITFAVTNVPYLLSPDNDAGGYVAAEIFYLAFKDRYGS
ncbi:hypothetical protein Drorol1_Dr00018962 [Drosera rotundifolia]